MAENFVGNRPDAILFQMSARATTGYQKKREQHPKNGEEKEISVRQGTQ